MYEDWLPSWLGTYADGRVFKLQKYTGYKPNVHPQIMHVFQSAAMRFGHTLVPPGVYRRRYVIFWCPNSDAACISLLKSLSGHSYLLSRHKANRGKKKSLLLLHLLSQISMRILDQVTRVQLHICASLSSFSLGVWGLDCNVKQRGSLHRTTTLWGKP